MPALPPERLRIDKWLWVARFYKTRSLAAEEVERGRVRVNGAEVKPSRELKAGDTLEVRIGPVVRTVSVRAMSLMRGPAPAAALLYAETAESLERRAQQAEQRRLAPEPGLSFDSGRPTKRDRRDLDRASGGPAPWDDRWSASLDD